MPAEKSKGMKQKITNEDTKLNIKMPPKPTLGWNFAPDEERAMRKAMRQSVEFMRNYGGYSVVDEMLRDFEKIVNCVTKEIHDIGVGAFVYEGERLAVFGNFMVDGIVRYDKEESWLLNACAFVYNLEANDAETGTPIAPKMLEWLEVNLSGRIDEYVKEQFGGRRPGEHLVPKPKLPKAKPNRGPNGKFASAKECDPLGW